VARSPLEQANASAAWLGGNGRHFRLDKGFKVRTSVGLELEVDDANHPLR
jgi:hypothetical protein